MKQYHSTIGIPIFRNVNNLKNLVFSLLATFSDLQKYAEMVVYDNGTTDEGIASETLTFCRQTGLSLIRSESNLGVAAAWNRLVRHSKTEVVFILNDDVRATAPGWFDSITAAFDLNPTVGIVYWCQKQVDVASGAAFRYTADSKYLVETEAQAPLLRSNFCGAFFALRKSLWTQINQPDGSQGFWEDLWAYGEEIDFSSECHKRGMHILQLPVLWEHLRGQTFQRNPDQRLRKTLSPYLTESEYRQFLNTHAAGAHVNQARSRVGSIRKSIRWLKNYNRNRKSTQAQGVERLYYSLAMVLKKWQHRTILGQNGPDYIAHLLRDGYPTALSDAIIKRAIVFPESLRYVDRGVQRSASIVDCLRDPTASLV